MRRRHYKYVMCACVGCWFFIYYVFGIGDYIMSKDFAEFDYPLNIDLKPVITDILSGKKTDTKPINYYPYKFLTNSGKCNTVEKLDLFIAVKSAMDHFDHRDAIRQTYGQENLIPGRIVKVLFFLGIDKPPKSDTQKQIEQEMSEYKDIIQIDFYDDYTNNTIKTMMTFRWVYQHCSTADYYLFTDDDMYISVINLLDYVHDREGASAAAEWEARGQRERERGLLAGYVFESSPQRFLTSKWRVTLAEFPWNRWPPYVTAGAYVVSNESMKVIYVASLYVKHFRFDDIYLGIVALKVGLKPTHCDQFHFYKKPYSRLGYANVIASHGYGDRDELVKVWKDQNENI